MRAPKLTVAVVGLALSGLVPAVSSAQEAGDCAWITPEPLAFDERVTIDATRAGGEPVTIVAPDGSINVSAHAGTTHIYKDPAAGPGYSDFLYGYANQTLNWHSTDGGASWDYVGTAGLPWGPHSATSTGFSDPDYAMDLGGRIYNTEIDLANVAVFSSDDYGRSYNLANPEAASGDRPWLTGGEADEVYLYVNSPKQLWRSTDAGITWSLVTLDLPATGKLIRDPLNPTAGLIGPVGTNGIAISEDEGQTWTRQDGASMPNGTQFFGATAVDDAGNAYVVSAGGYHGSGDTAPDGFVWFNSFQRDPDDLSGGSWGTPVPIPIPDGDAMWPWITAGDDGRVAVVWYQTIDDPDTGAYDPNAFYAFAAVTTNGHGAVVPCADGTTRVQPPTFSVANASHDPIHVGDICLSGTTCNASVDFEAGDRRLGDFFTVEHLLDGTVYLVSGDTTRENPLGGPKPVGNPVFIKQVAGPKLLATPVEPGPSRCLANLAVLCPDG